MKFLSSARTRRERVERTSWVQFESVVRKMGDARAADKIYRKRMCQEAKYEQSKSRKTGSFLWWLISGYGTRSWLIVLWCIVVIAWGTGTLLHSNAAVYSPLNGQGPA